jgi:uncharacterized repeat protein (TIGR01451 family)
MNTKAGRLLLTLALGLGATMALLWLLGNRPELAIAAPAAELHVCPSGCTYSSAQTAVDAASDGDIIKVAAGTYTDVHQRNGITQVVYITKTVTIRGGYTTTNWTTSDPNTYTTTLDAQGQGRVLYVAGSINLTVEGLRITGGKTAQSGSSGASGGGIYIASDAVVTLTSSIVSGNSTADGISSGDGGSGGGICNLGTLTLDDSAVIGNATGNGGNNSSGMGGDGGRGGGIYSKGQLILHSSTIMGNVTGNGGNNIFSSFGTYGGDGGGIYIANYSMATVTSSTIAINVTGNAGGGAYNPGSDFGCRGGDGGGIYSDGTLSLANTTIYGNIAGAGRLDDCRGGYGGGIYNDRTLTISSSDIRDNQATGIGVAGSAGGGIYSDDGTLVLISSLVADNHARNNGNGIYLKDSLGQLMHTTIARNTVNYASGVYVTSNSTVALTNTILVSHTTGIYVTSGSAVMLEATLWGSDDWANGTDWGGSGTIVTGTVNIWSDPAFANPDAGDYHIDGGSAARDAGVAAGVTSDIDGQFRPMGWSYDLGADEYADAGLDIIKRRVAVEDFANAGQVLTYTVTITSAGVENATGVVLTDTLDVWQQPIAANSTLGGCSVANGGWGGTVVCSPGTMIAGTTVEITLTVQVSSTIVPPQLLVNSALVESNETANSAQTATYAQDCHVRINDDPKEYSTVQAAVDAATPGDVVKVAGYCLGVNGRGELRQQVYLDKGLTIQGGYATDNWTTPDPEANPTTLDAWGQGRALYITSDITATIEELRITGGNADGLGGDSWGDDAGGGVYVITATVTISDCEVISNTVLGLYGLGGGLYQRSGAVTLTGNAISDNSAEYGGGLYQESGAVTLAGNAISGNSADHGGGLYSASGTVVLVSNSISGNTAAGSGGGLYRSFLGDGTLSGSGNSISGNTAAGSGGGLYIGNSAVDPSEISLVGNTVSGNMAYGGGGGLYLAGDVALSGNIVISNTAGYGGGLYLERNNATLANDIVADNHATSAGGGFYIERSSPLLLHSTIARNTGGDGSGLYVTDDWGQYSTVVMTNTILVSHTVGITITTGNTATLEATLWGSGSWANVTDWGGAGTIVTGAVNIQGDPAFVDPDSGDYHIGPESAARDAGVDAGVTTDIDGDPRPAEQGYDIGADELRVALKVTKQATPDPAQPGELLTYTISITNTGNVTLTATITDILPAQVTPSGSLTWTASITAPSGVWTEQFTVTVNTGYAGVLTNVVQVTTEEGATGAYTNTVSTFPTVDFSDPSYDVSESGGSAIITVTLSQATALTVTVDYATGGGTATAGSDYDTSSGTLVFTPGVTSQTFTVPITQDSWDEYDETVTLMLTNADNATIGGNNPATLTIEDDDDPPNLSISDASVTEGDSGNVDAVFTVTLSVASGKPITVEYATADGSATAPDDYTSVSTTTLTFDPGETTQLVTITVKGDTLDEDNEALWVNLTNLVNASVSDDQGQGTILDDDDPPSLSISDTSVTEGDSGSVNAVFTVTLFTVSGRMVMVEYATADGSATAPSDYTAISTTTLTFDPGVTTRLVTVTVKGDTLDEPNETFFVNLGNATNASIVDGQGQGIIVDDDGPPSLSISDATVTEGDSGSMSAVFTVTLSVASGKTVTVEYATADGSAIAPGDYTAISTTTLTFDPGVTTRLVTVTVKGDTLHEDNETFFVNLGNPTNANISDGQSQGTIQDDDGPPTVSFGNTTYSVNEDAGTVSIVVTLDAPSALTVTVGYTATGGTATSGEDYEIVSGTLIFAPGFTSQMITVTIIDDEVDEGEETIILTLYDPINTTIGDGTAVLTITEEFKVYLPLVLRGYP